MSKREKVTIGIHFGAMCDPVYKQLKKQGFPLSKDKVSHFQRAVDGLVQLRILGCLGDAEMNRTSQRLIGKIAKFVELETKNNR